MTDDARIDALIREAFAGFGVDVVLAGEVARRRDGSKSYSLLQLRRACRQALSTGQDLERFVTEGVQVLMGDELDLTTLPPERILAHVTAQLAPLEEMPPALRRSLSYGLPIGDDLLGILMYDLGRYAFSIPEEVVRRFPPGELQRAGVSRRAAAPPGRVEWLSGASGNPFRVVRGTVPFASSMILAMPELLRRVLPGRDVPNGVFVAVPDHMDVGIHPVDGPADRAAMIDLAVFARVAHRQSSAALSPHLYWWRAGRFTRITRFVDGGIAVDTTGELGDVLDGRTR